MDKITEDLKRMFYQVALATEKKRSQLERLKELGERMTRATTAIVFCVVSLTTLARADQIIKLKDDGTYIRTAEFLKAVRITEGTIQEAVMLDRSKATVVLTRFDELDVNKVANLLEDNGYELDEETRLLNPFVLKVSWEPFVSPAEHDKAVRLWAIQEHQREMQFMGENQ